MNLTTLCQIQQTTRRGNDEQCATQTGHLLAIRHAAHNGGYANTFAVLEQVDGVLCHLLCQLTGWAQDQCGRANHTMQVDRRVVAFGHDGVDYWQQEGGGFTATCLAAHHPVATFDGRRNGFGLNRCWLGKSQVLDGLE